jgi:hypothetical protein
VALGRSVRKFRDQDFPAPSQQLEPAVREMQVVAGTARNASGGIRASALRQVAFDPADQIVELRQGTLLIG